MAYVQGSIRPGGKYVRDFDQQMFGLGFHVTSGYRCSGSYHGCGPVPEGGASDYGDSVNNLRKQWLIAWPHRFKIAEMLGPWGLYRYGQRFYNQTLQAAHMDHNHFAITRKIRLKSSAKKVHPWDVLLAGERKMLSALEAKRRIAKRNGGWHKVDASHLREAEELKAELIIQRKKIWRAAQKSGWDRFDRRARYNLLVKYTK
jgi:hypothetical protein